MATSDFDGVSPESPYQAGHTIDDKFQLLKPIGSGGMGTVWVAHNLILDVQVGSRIRMLQAIACWTKRDRRRAWVTLP